MLHVAFDYLAVVHEILELLDHRTGKLGHCMAAEHQIRLLAFVGIGNGLMGVGQAKSI